MFDSSLLLGEFAWLQLHHPRVHARQWQSPFYELTGEVTSKVNSHSLSRSHWLQLPNPSARRRIFRVRSPNLGAKVNFWEKVENRRTVGDGGDQERRTLRILVYSVIYDSGKVSLEYLLLSLYPSPAVNHEATPTPYHPSPPAIEGLVTCCLSISPLSGMHGDVQQLPKQRVCPCADSLANTLSHLPSKHTSTMLDGVRYRLGESGRAKRRISSHDFRNQRLLDQR